MKRAWIFLVALVVASGVGCDTDKTAPTLAAPKPQVDSQIGRFQTFDNLAGVVLDTKTGQLCRTYDWHTPKNDSRVIDLNHFDTTPLCTDIQTTADSRTGRFQPFKNLAGVALDTRTGRLCKTYDWNIEERRKYQVVVRSPYEKAPLCSAI
jgi:hypothetical protein